MKENRWFAVVFMFVITAIFSSLLIGINVAVQDRIQANRQFALELAVLEVLNVKIPAGSSQRDIHEIFVKDAKPPAEDIGAYRLYRDGRVVGYAVLVGGEGFWAPIKGVVGFAPDRKTITGVAFFEQNETPGLGAQITTEDFRNQFKGKTLSLVDEPIGIRPITAELKANQVHAVSGATQTSVRLEKLINDSLADWQIAARQSLEQ